MGMNWKHIREDFYGWYAARVWKAAHQQMRGLRLARTEMRLFMLCSFTHRGPDALAGYDVIAVLAIRSLCGRRWFDWQLLACDAGHEVTDPYRTLV